jgi:hypothetical protein
MRECVVVNNKYENSYGLFKVGGFSPVESVKRRRNVGVLGKKRGA